MSRRGTRVQSALQDLRADPTIPAEVSNLEETIDFRVLAENIPHIVWAAGVDGATTYFNEHGSILLDCLLKRITGGVGYR